MSSLIAFPKKCRAFENNYNLFFSETLLTTRCIQKGGSPIQAQSYMTRNWQYCFASFQILGLHLLLFTRQLMFLSNHCLFPHTLP